MQLAKVQKTYNDFLVFEKQAIQGLHYSLGEIENTDYFLLMDILSADDALAQEDVYEDPLAAIQDLGI